MRSQFVAVALMLAVTASVALADQAPTFGRVAAPDEISSWDIDVSPDGTGLPPGSATARTGEAVYAQKCVACHGVKGVGGPAGDLAGGQGTLGVPGKRPVKTVGSFWPYATSFFAYVRRAMPYDKPKSLTNDELYAVTAYVLQLNGLIGADEVMNALTLPKVRMPNRDGFRPWVRGD